MLAEKVSEVYSEVPDFIKIIHSEIEYDSAIEQIEKLWGSEPATKEGELLDVLLVLVEDYENKNHSIEPAHPIEAIKLRMATLDVSRNDIVKDLSISSGVLSEVLTLKRGLSMAMIRGFSEKFSLSYECLCQPYTLVK